MLPRQRRINMNFFDELKNYDSEVFAACDAELSRQQGNIELIASENIVSKAVLLAAGGVLTNKYAEGYPIFSTFFQIRNPQIPLCSS